MSQLRRVGKPSIGKLAIQVKLSWPDFVQLALQLTIQAYQAMYADKIAERDWEENVFTVRLGEDYLRPISFEYPIRIDIRNKVHTDNMKLGKQKTIEAKEIDLSLYDIWEEDYLKRKFIWEAKRIGDKRYHKSYQTLNSEYINEAIYRFIHLEYAFGLDDAGVLGYILAGDAINIVTDINQTMSKIRVNPPLSQSNNLSLGEPIGEFKNIYSSNHTRTNSTNIHLHHLFLTFNFD